MNNNNTEKKILYRLDYYAKYWIAGTNLEKLKKEYKRHKKPTDKLMTITKIIETTQIEEKTIHQNKIQTF